MVLPHNRSPSIRKESAFFYTLAESALGFAALFLQHLGR